MVSLADLATLGGRELSYRYELGVCGDHEFTVEKPCRPARSPGPGAWPAGAPPPPRTAATGTRTTTGIASRPRSRNPGTSTISRASTARSPASPANRTRPATQRDDGALREPRRRTTTSGNEQDPRSHPPPASAEPGTTRDQPCAGSPPPRPGLPAVNERADGVVGNGAALSLGFLDPPALYGWRIRHGSWPLADRPGRG